MFYKLGKSTNICFDSKKSIGHEKPKLEITFFLTNDDDANRICWIMKLNRSKIIDNSPSCQDGNNADRSTRDPSSLVIVSLDSED